MGNLLQNRYLAFLTGLVKQFIRNRGILNAAALTYTTLFAVVPLMTVTYAMLAAIPTFQGVGQELQGWIFDNFVPATGAVVQDYLHEFSSQARKLTAIGVILLIITSIMMMKNIEAAFNRIWRVTEARKGLSSFLLYWAILSLGPILIGLGLVVTSYVATLPFISSATEVVGKARLISMLPALLSAIAFTLIYVAVPNCRVPFKSALIGGVVVALLFETAKRSFTAFVTQFPSYELIYGAFAAVPLFLLWIFISWVIILLGAELTRKITVYRAGHMTKGVSDLQTVLEVMHNLWQAQSEGRTVSDRTLLRQIGPLDQGRWDDYQQLLLEANLIQRSEQGEYLLSRDMGTLSLDQLVRILPWPLPERVIGQNSVWQQVLQDKLETVSSQQHQTMALTLEQLFESSKSSGDVDN